MLSVVCSSCHTQPHWHWFDESAAKWIPYSDDINALLERGLIREDPNVKTQIGRQKITVTFSTMMQVSVCAETTLKYSSRNGFVTGAVMAEWLRRWTRNPMGFPRAGSNPAHCAFLLFFFFFFSMGGLYLCCCVHIYT